MLIIGTKPYKRAIKKLKASADDVLRMESSIADAPESGDEIPGLEGIRKARFRIGNRGNRGKRGGGRVVYFVAFAVDRLYFLKVFAKADQEDLTQDDKQMLKMFVIEAKAQLSQGQITQDMKSGEPHGEEDEAS